MTDTPAAFTVVGDADFTTDSDAVCVADTAALDGSEVAVMPLGPVPEAVAVFVTEPASMSA